MFVSEKGGPQTKRLFGGLAVLAIGFVFACPAHLVTLYNPTTVIFVHPSLKQLQVIAALISTVSALAYFPFRRWSAHSLDNSFSLVHFILLAVGVVLINLTAISFKRSSIWNGNFYKSDIRLEGISAIVHWPWPVRLLTIGLWCVELACVVFAVNLGMMIFNVLRLRRKSLSQNIS